jgi:hypothetical protein
MGFIRSSLWPDVLGDGTMSTLVYGSQTSTRVALIGAVFGVMVLLGGCAMAPTDVDPAPFSSPSSGASAGGDRPTSNDDRVGRPAAEQGVAGVVRDSTGRPVSGVMIDARAEGGSPPVPELAILSDRQGRFMWPLQPGTYRLQAGAAGTGVTVIVRPGAVVSVDLIAR